jgi:hypothetical protein
LENSGDSIRDEPKLKNSPETESVGSDGGLALTHQVSALLVPEEHLCFFATDRTEKTKPRDS